MRATMFSTAMKFLGVPFLVVLLLCALAPTEAPAQDSSISITPDILERLEFLEGTVESITPLPFNLVGWVVRLDTGIVLTNPGTRTVDARGVSIPFGDVVVGDRVIAGYLDTTAGRQSAIIVRLYSDSTPTTEVVRGRVVEVIPATEFSEVLLRRFPGITGLLILENAVMLVFETTSIRKAGVTVGLDALRPGLVVDVRTRLRVNWPGLPEAALIQVVHDANAPPHGIVEVLGRIEALQLYTSRLDSSLPIVNEQLGLMRVAGKFFDIRSNTQIVDREGASLAARDLAVGNLVRLRAEDVGMLTVVPAAIHIKRLESGFLNPPVSIQGTVLEIDEANRSFTVRHDHSTLPLPTPNPDGGVKILTGNSTVYSAPFSSAPLGFEDLHPGGRVAIHGHRNSFGEYVAERVVFLTIRPPSDTIIVDGVVESIARVELPTIDSGATALLPPSRTPIALVVVEGVSFLVDEDTVFLRGDRRVSDSLLEVGMRVSVLGVPHGADTNLAKRIRLLENRPTLPQRINLDGHIEAIDEVAQTFVLRGTLVRVDNMTIIKSSTGQNLTIEDLDEGTRVNAQCLSIDDNTVLARLIVVLQFRPDPIEEVQWAGRITTISHEEGILTLGDLRRTVRVTNETSIQTSAGEEVDIRSLQEGSLIQVSGRLEEVDLFAPQRGLLLIASQIVLLREGLVETAFSGAIEALNDAAWVVGGRRVMISDETRLADRERNPLEIGDFSVGDRVQVIGRATPDRVVQAIAILLIHRPGEIGIPEPITCRPDVAFGGAVVDLDAGGATFRIGDRVVQFTDETRVIKPREGEVGMAMLAEGDTVYISGRRNNGVNGVDVVACVIRIQGEWEAPPREHRVSGRIEFINPTEESFTVRDITVDAGAASITNRAGELLSFDALAPGALVFVAGIIESNATLLAKQVVLLTENFDPRSLPPYLIGRLTADPGSEPVSINIDGTDVVTTSETRWIGILGEVVQPEALLAGDAVHALRVDSTVRAVRHLGEVLHRIDTANSIIRTSLGAARVSSDTVFIDALGGEGTIAGLGDLMIGDLLHVRILPGVTDEAPPTATMIRVLRRAERSADIPPFTRVGHGTEDGRPTLTVNNPSATFGYVSLPFEGVVALPNTLYELEMELSSNLDDRQRIPTSRLRVNRSDFSRGALLDIAATGSRLHLPTTVGVRHRLYFVPEALRPDSTSGREFFASLDLLSLDPAASPNARLRLDGMNLRPIPFDRVQVVGTLYRANFQNGTDGWEFGASPLQTPARHGMEPGGLTLAPEDHDTFGYWDRITGVKATSRTLYRGRFLVRSSTDARSTLPTLRVRLNTSTFEFGSSVNVERLGANTDAPGTTPRWYDVYLYLPEGSAEGSGILAAFDLLSFDSGIDTGTSYTLEEMVLEEVRILD